MTTNSFQLLIIFFKSYFSYPILQERISEQLEIRCSAIWMKVSMTERQKLQDQSLEHSHKIENDIPKKGLNKREQT